MKFLQLTDFNVWLLISCFCLCNKVAEGRHEREHEKLHKAPTKLGLDIPADHPIFTGLKVESEIPEGGNENGISAVPTDSLIILRIFGEKLSNKTMFVLTPNQGNRNDNCNDMQHSDKFMLIDVVSSHMATAEITVTNKEYTIFYICVKNNEASPWIHQGNDRWLMLEARTKLFALYVQILIICFLLCLSGLFAGLNLGLMSLDKNELRVISLSGSESEKRYAKQIEPIRRKGNYLLCTILLTNVMINSTTTVLLDQLTTGLIAVVTSTLSIVIFGDIIPQAICSRHGLAVGAKTIYITYLFMAITFPLAYPISKVLDLVLGEEIGQVYDRKKLMEFIRVTKDYSKLGNEEVNMITGALNLKNKTAAEVMTRLEDVFMLPIHSILDFETVSLIQKRGYSRIPVYDDERKNITALFHAKDLAFCDPSDHMPLRTLIEFYNHPLIDVDINTKLDVVLNQFKEGKSHLAFVRQSYTSDEVDPYFEITGIVTLEDVIEEIIQAEIVDETDTLSDNRQKKRRKNARQDFSEFAKIGHGNANNLISPQMALAAFQFLCSSIEPFSSHYLTETVLQRLLSQKIYHVHRVAEDDEEGQEKEYLTLFKTGDAIDYFLLILEGRVKVTIGRERLTFVSGPFTYFGIEALREPAIEIEMENADETSTKSDVRFVSDYAVEIIETTTYIKIPRDIYLLAYKASILEKSRGGDNCSVDKLMLSRTFSDDIRQRKSSGHGSISPNGISNPSYSPDYVVQSPDQCLEVVSAFERPLRSVSEPVGHHEMLNFNTVYEESPVIQVESPTMNNNNNTNRQRS